MRAVTEPLDVSTVLQPSVPVTAQGRRISTPNSHARASNSASKSCRQT